MNHHKITLFCSSYPPETGAAPGRMYHLAQMLRSKGYEVSVICAMPNYPTGKIFATYKGKIICHEEIEGIKITRIWLIPTHSSNKAKRLLSLFSYSLSLCTLGFYYLLKSKPALIFVSSPPFVTGYFGLMLSRFTNAKTILNISDLWPKTAYDLGFLKEGKLYRFLTKMEQKMYAQADAISVQSEQIKQHISGLQKKKEIFIYRNLQPPYPQANNARPAGKRKIIYAGLLGIAQGVFEIINAIDFKSLETELHIYGEGNQLNKIKDWVDNNPHKGIYYKGSLPAHALPEIQAQYHAMLIPLSTEIEGAVPSKVFNAIANGLPIIFSGNGEAANIIRQNKIGWINNAGDFEGLKKNIIRLVKMNDEEYDEMRINTIACSKTAFNKSTQDESFANFLKQIILSK